MGVAGNCLLPPEIFAESDPPSCKTHQFQPRVLAVLTLSGPVIHVASRHVCTGPYDFLDTVVSIHAVLNICQRKHCSHTVSLRKLSSCLVNLRIALNGLLCAGVPLRTYSLTHCMCVQLFRGGRDVESSALLTASRCRMATAVCY